MLFTIRITDVISIFVNQTSNDLLSFNINDLNASRLTSSGPRAFYFPIGGNSSFEIMSEISITFKVSFYKYFIKHELM